VRPALSLTEFQGSSAVRVSRKGNRNPGRSVRSIMASIKPSLILPETSISN
jgi:hypothetical protein